MLLDTSGLLCYFHKDEPKHVDAQTLFEAAGAKVVHNYVLAEFVALAGARSLPRQPSPAFLATLLEHPEVVIVWVTEALHRESMKLLELRLDKLYSLCDAVSFVLMRQRGIGEAVTTDRQLSRKVSADS